MPRNTAIAADRSWPVVLLCVSLLSWRSGNAAELRGAVVDAATEQPVPARVYVCDAKGGWHFVRSTSPEGSAVRYEKQNWINKNAVEFHTTVSAHPFAAELAAGRYRVTVERGKEYFPWVREVELDEDGVTLDIRLKRWIDMAERGWFSGETHIHRTIAELRNVALAEDLNVSFPLSYWVTRAFQAPTSGDRNLGGVIPDQLVRLDRTHVIWPRNTEYEIFTVGGKRHTLGALFLLNHRPVLSEGVPPWGPVARKVVSEGGLLDMDKLDWPVSFTLPHATGAQLYELANNHVWRTEFGFTEWNSFAPPFLEPPFGGKGGGEREWIHYTLGMYYALLNCGYRLVPTAGTANGVHPVPAGFSRVYVHLSEGFSYARWLEGLRRGRSFVTTGPMLFATVEGRHPGETIRTGKGELRLSVEGVVRSERPLAFIEVVRDGTPALTFMPRNRRTDRGAYETDFSGEIGVARSGWVVVRAWEDTPNGRTRFAHSAPWHFELEGRPLRPRREDRDFLVQRMRDEISRSGGVLPAEALAEYQRVLAAHEAIEVEDDSAEIARVARPLRDDRDLRYWLESMVRHHRYTMAEVRRATGLGLDAISAALDRFGIERSADARPRDPSSVLLLPYPGGRHPRRGFLDGAVDPQRESKVSVFPPWDDGGYVVIDVPEAIFSNLGLLYLAHTHVPTVWTERGEALPRLEWQRRGDGSLEIERDLPGGVAFGAKVVPGPQGVRMELWIRNGTPETLTGLRVQNCVMLKAATGFDAQTNQNKRLTGSYAAVRSGDGRRWIITTWDRCRRLWANPPVPCMHADPEFEDCPAGATRRLRGSLTFYEGDDIDGELRRLEETARK